MRKLPQSLWGNFILRTFKNPYEKCLENFVIDMGTPTNYYELNVTTQSTFLYCGCGLLTTHIEIPFGLSIYTFYLYRPVSIFIFYLYQPIAIYTFYLYRPVSVYIPSAYCNDFVIFFIRESKGIKNTGQ